MNKTLKFGPDCPGSYALARRDRYIGMEKSLIFGGSTPVYAGRCPECNRFVIGSPEGDMLRLRAHDAHDTVCATATDEGAT